MSQERTGIDVIEELAFLEMVEARHEAWKSGEISGRGWHPNQREMRLVTALRFFVGEINRLNGVDSGLRAKLQEQDETIKKIIEANGRLDAGNRERDETIEGLLGQLSER